MRINPISYPSDNIGIIAQISKNVNHNVYTISIPDDEAIASNATKDPYQYFYAGLSVSFREIIGRIPGLESGEIQNVVYTGVISYSDELGLHIAGTNATKDNMEVVIGVPSTVPKDHQVPNIYQIRTQMVAAKGKPGFLSISDYAKFLDSLRVSEFNFNLMSYDYPHVTNTIRIPIDTNSTKTEQVTFHLHGLGDDVKFDVLYNDSDVFIQNYSTTDKIKCVVGFATEPSGNKHLYFSFLYNKSTAESIEPKTIRVFVAHRNNLRLQLYNDNHNSEDYFVDVPTITSPYNLDLTKINRQFDPDLNFFDGVSKPYALVVSKSVWLNNWKLQPTGVYFVQTGSEPNKDGFDFNSYFVEVYEHGDKRFYDVIDFETGSSAVGIYTKSTDSIVWSRPLSSTSKIPADNIIENDSKKFVTKRQIEAWNANSIQLSQNAWLPPVANEAALPSTNVLQGARIVTLDTNKVWKYNNGWELDGIDDIPIDTSSEDQNNKRTFVSQYQFGKFLRRFMKRLTPNKDQFVNDETSSELYDSHKTRAEKFIDMVRRVAPIPYLGNKSINIGFDNNPNRGKSVKLGSDITTVPSGDFTSVVIGSDLTTEDEVIVIGKFNKPEANMQLVFGNGTDNENRKNIFGIDNDGNIVIEGIIKSQAADETKLLTGNGWVNRSEFVSRDDVAQFMRKDRLTVFRHVPIDYTGNEEDIPEINIYLD